DLSPDGKTFVTFEEVPGTHEGRATRAATLWEVAAGKKHPLPGGLHYGGRYSADSRTLAMVAEDDNNFAQSIKLIDTSDGKERRTFPIADKRARLTLLAISPDGRLLVGDYGVLEPEEKDREKSQCWLKWWD